MEAVFGLCKSDSNIPISHLDYKYIEKCDDAKEIGKILKILRLVSEQIINTTFLGHCNLNQSVK